MWVQVFFIYCIYEASAETYFIKEGTVYTTFNSWILTFSVDLQPYRDNLATVAREMVKIEQALNALHSQNQVATNQTLPLHQQRTRKIWLDTMSLFSQGIAQLRAEYESIQDLLSELTSLVNKYNPSRRKRALLPFVGNLLKSLFGTATDSDLSELREAIISLSDFQAKIAHVVKDTLSIINKSHKEIQQNRNAINLLVNTSLLFRNRVNSLTRAITQVVLPELTQVQLITHLHAIFHEVSIALRHVQLLILNLMDQVTLSTQGILSFRLLKQSELVTILRQVKLCLTGDLVVPFKLIAKHVFSYYNYLHPIVIPEEDKFHIVVAIPLIHPSSLFDVYHTVSVPSPVSAELSASHVLESSHIAFSKDESEYAFLHADEVRMCSQAPICHLSSPLYKTSYYSSCMASLFQNQVDKVGEFCKVTMENTKEFPVIKYLFDGYWLISTGKSFQLTITCDRQTPRVIRRDIPIGVQVVELKVECAAYSKYFELPKHVKGNSPYDVNVELIQDMKLDVLKVSIWNQTQPLLQKLSVLNSSLSERNTLLSNVDAIPIKHMQALLQEVEDTSKPNLVFATSTAYNFGKVIFSLAALLIIFGTVVILILCVCKRRFKHVKFAKDVSYNVAPSIEAEELQVSLEQVNTVKDEVSQTDSQLEVVIPPTEVEEAPEVSN